MDNEARFALLEAAGLVKLDVVHDDHHSFEDYEGDVYNPAANPDLPAEQLAQERERDRAKFYAEGGAWGLVGYVSLHGRWQHVDSVWGMYPRAEAEAKDNEYRDGIVAATLAKIDEVIDAARRTADG